MTQVQSNLADLSFAQLKDLDVQVSHQIVLARKGELDAARSQIQEIARSVGLSVHELAGTFGAKVKSSSAKAAKTPRLALYTNPANKNEQWSGRGRPPNWVKACQADGRSLEEFRITGH